MTGKLTQENISEIQKPGLYSDGDCLYLQVSHNNSKSWVFRYTRNHRTREIGLGSVRVASLEDARSKAMEIRKKLNNERDPLGYEKLPFVRSFNGTLSYKVLSKERIVKAATPLGVEIDSAVYFLIDESGEIIYVGSSRQVYKRLFSWKKRGRFQFSRAAILYCVEDVRLILEEMYIREFSPKHNKTFKGN